MPIPKFDVPLSRVAIGCVGPVPMTEKKHHTYQRSPGHLKEAKEKPTNKQLWLLMETRERIETVCQMVTEARSQAKKTRKDIMEKKTGAEIWSTSERFSFVA